MTVKASMKYRTAGREEIRARRNGTIYILPKEGSRRGGRLKARTPISRRKKALYKKKRKF